MKLKNFCRLSTQMMVIFLIAWLTSFSAHAQNQDAQLLYHRALAATCANCHGTEGKGIENAGMPLINQLTEKNMLSQLMAYKTGERTGTIMPQLMKGYTDEQLQLIANVLGKK
jgi:cytochrome c553